MLLHHTLGNGDFTVYAHRHRWACLLANTDYRFSKMSANLSVNVAHLNEPSTAAELIDNAIKQCYVQSRPVYLTLPSDSVTKQVEGARLKEPIDLSFSSNNEEQEDFVVADVLRYLNAAKKPIILVDACTIRHRVSLVDAMTDGTLIDSPGYR